MSLSGKNQLRIREAIFGHGFNSSQKKLLIRFIDGERAHAEAPFAPSIFLIMREAPRHSLPERQRSRIIKLCESMKLRQ